ncbi:hypothetical protein D5S17_29210 [Pseudonocardiaceae bacterium YIM PH 21723]|nr:hypothetical protein D5S17_29210 [Pseudonocardiaceae bacterium YIM PH 21723]
MAAGSMIGAGAPRSVDGCTWTGLELEHLGLPGVLPQIVTATDEVLGSSDDGSQAQLLRWQGIKLTATPLEQGVNLLWLRGADATGRAAGSIGIQNSDAPLHVITIKDGQITELALPEGVISGEVKGVNARGDIVASGYDGHDRHYLQWAPGATAADDLRHSRFRDLAGITDDSSLVVDWATDDGHTRAATYLKDKETLLPLPEGSTDSWAKHVSGEWIIGQIGTAAGPQQWVVWHNAGAPRVLPAGFEPASINKDGLIVGRLDGQAAVLRQQGAVQQLGPGTKATWINDKGTVVGSAGPLPMSWTCPTR